MKRFILILFIACLLMAPSQKAVAGMAPWFFGNGDFETGDLTYWEWTGDIWVADYNVISGTYSAFLTTLGNEDVPLSENPAFNDMCSWLHSGLAYPEYVPQSVIVSFKVRYKTDEYPGDIFCEDPFTAKLVTMNGTVETVVIEADGITPGPKSRVLNTSTGAFLSWPTLPPFVCEELDGITALQNGLFFCETPVLEVRQEIPYTMCEPVLVKFGICDACDAEVGSAAFIDDVSITFVTNPMGLGQSAVGRPTTGGTPCPPPEIPEQSFGARGR